ncbi:MAG: type III pantothenate kinase [Planctomycetota bacterium]
MVGEQHLLADLGNQRLKIADASLSVVHSFAWREASECQRLANYLISESVRGVTLASSSVQGCERLLDFGLHAVEVSMVQPEQVPLQIKSIGTGIDRLLASWLVHHRTQSAVVVADCGTALTLDVVNAEGCFLGGAIGAGLGLQERALAQACPHLDAPNEQRTGIPADTASAVAAGTRRAFAHGITALATEFLHQQTEAQCFLTGGDAKRLLALMPGWKLEENLVLQALAALHR